MFFGTDPETFILDEGGKSVPAHMRLPGKASPVGVAMNGKKKGYFSFFRDGYAVEVNVSPSSSIIELIYKVQAAYDALRTFVLREGEHLTTRPAVPVDWSKMEGAPPDVLETGCDPSEDAYTGKQKFPSMDPKSNPDRMAGGHMHFSAFKRRGEAVTPWAMKEHIPTKVKQLDLHVGLPLTFLFPTREGFNRRTFYGQAGEFRFQDYGNASGLEYRVPTPEIFSHPAIASLAFSSAKATLERVHEWDTCMEEDLRGAINFGIDMEKLLRPLEGVYDLSLLKKAKELLKRTDSPLGLDPDPQSWESFVWTNLQDTLPKAA